MPNTIISLRRAWGLMALVVLLWGVNWPVMKIGLGYISPLYFTVARMLLGSLVLAIVAITRGALHWPRRGDWPLVFGVGLLQMAAFLSLVNVALQYVPAGRSAILAYTTSLWVVPLAAIVLHERMAPAKLAGFALGLGGVAVLFNPFGFNWHDPHILMGNGLLLLAALFWALLIVFVRGYHGVSSPLTLGVWQFLLAGLATLPVALLFEDASQIQFGWPLGLVLLYNGPLATAFCYWGMITVTRALPAVTTSLATLAVPATGMLASAAVLGESLTGTNGLGLMLILAGLALVSLADRAMNRRAVAEADN